MTDRSCRVCEAPLSGRQQLYCSRACNVAATTARRDAAYFATYRAENAQQIAALRRTRRIERTCVTCGETWKTHRKDAVYCSTICRIIAQGAPTVCAWQPPEQRTCGLCAAVFTARTNGQRYCTTTCATRAENQRRHGLPPWCPQPRDCAWCGKSFTPNRRVETHCSGTCGDRAGRARRRALEAGAVGTYTWSEVMRVFLLLNRRCAYCRQLVVGQPDPDHVMPLSRGGSNSITNILPACRPCNADKRNLTLEEWAADRHRRGLAPVLTDLPNEAGYTHLTSVVHRSLVPA